jgi:hypothetical protein
MSSFCFSNVNVACASDDDDVTRQQLDQHRKSTGQGGQYENSASPSGARPVAVTKSWGRVLALRLQAELVPDRLASI